MLTYIIGVILFLASFVLTAQWLQLKLVFTKSGRISPKEDKHVTSFLKEKAGLNIRVFRIIESEKPFGLMAGLFRPDLLISSKLYDTFTKAELEYVLLHEAGHFVKRHVLKELAYAISLAIAANLFFLTLSSTEVLLIGLPAGVILGIIMIQLGRNYEYEADEYAAKLLENRKGMVSATRKFEKHYKDLGEKHHLVRRLFYRGLPYKDRIDIAETFAKS